MLQRELYNPKFVTALFDEMSKTYGIVNSISSFGFCFFWRQQCAALNGYHSGETVVDLMSGMSELAITINRRNPEMAIEFVSIDLSSAMCKLADRSVAAKKINCKVINGDALHTGLPSGSVDKVVSTFGLKTFSHDQLKLLAAECFRILKPGGRLGFLEISVPPSRLLRIPYMLYLNRLIPIVGRMLLGNPDNYRLLGVYTKAFENCDRAIEIFRGAGFELQPKTFFFGCATGFSGVKGAWVSH